MVIDKEPAFQSFFDIDPRRPAGNAAAHSNTMDLVNDSFEHLFTHYKALLFPKVPSYTEHNLYLKVKERSEAADPELVVIKTADEVFAKYILEVFGKTNKDYFLFVTKFVILFRECINKYKTVESGDEFTKVTSAETVPDLCNEFITEFMEQNDYFGLDTNELIEIIQQFCYWLYENKFTTSRLTLVS
jgi:hypothetical protein